MANITITFPNALPVGIQVTDIAWYVDTSESTQIKMGPIITITGLSIVVNASAGVSPPTTEDFVFYAKDPMTVVGALKGYYAEAQLGCPQALTYTFSEIRSLLKDFDIYDMKKEHIFKYDIPEYIKGNYVITESFKNMTEESFAEMSEEMGWHTLVKATLREK